MSSVLWVTRKAGSDRSNEQNHVLRSWAAHSVFCPFQSLIDRLALQASQSQMATQRLDLGVQRAILDGLSDVGFGFR